MNSIWIGLVILGVATASPVYKLEDTFSKLLSTKDGERNSLLENLLISVMEDFRGTMVTGSDDIPVLDPFYLDRIYLDDATIPIPGAHVEVNEMTVSKLSTFELNSVSVSSASIILQRYNVAVDGEVPAIQVDVGKYDIFASVNGLSIFGNGNAKIVVVKPRLKVDLLVGVRPRLGAIYLNIINTRIELSLVDFQPHFTGMFGTPAVDSFVNLFLRNLVLELMGVYSEDITNAVSPIVQDLANDILSDLNLISILG